MGHGIHTAFFRSCSCCVASLRSEHALCGPATQPLLDGAGLLEHAPCVLVAGDGCMVGVGVSQEKTGRHGVSKVLVDSISG